jgi:hypothetical protein
MLQAAAEAGFRCASGTQCTLSNAHLLELAALLMQQPPLMGLLGAASLVELRACTASHGSAAD